jgi:hypothetical protein
LFGLLNPVIESMRGLCAASQFRRVQKQVCGSAVSLGNFSEAQTLVEPELLERVFDNRQHVVAGGQADELGVLEVKKRASRGV